MTGKGSRQDQNMQEDQFNKKQIELKVEWVGFPEEEQMTWECKPTHLLGRRCRVYEDGMPYDCTCVGYEANEHEFAYDAGSFEYLDLTDKKLQWELIIQ